MPQRPRPRNYRKRQQDSDDEEQVGVAEEGGVKDEAEEDAVRCVVLQIHHFCASTINGIFVEKSLKKLKSYRNLEKNQLV